jgi:hypothetical protein
MSDHDPYSDLIAFVFLKNSKTVRVCHASDPQSHVTLNSEAGIVSSGHPGSARGRPHVTQVRSIPS